MNGYRLRQTVVLAAGFFAGAMLAICIAPGDFLLWIVTGAVLGLFARACFADDLSAVTFWALRKRHVPAPPDPEPVWHRKPRNTGPRSRSNPSHSATSSQAAKSHRKQRLHEMNRQACHRSNGR